MNKQTNYKAIKNRQSGISLLMALVMLTGIMMVGVLTYTVSDTQYKQSGNQQFQAAALVATEGALTAAETWLIEGGPKGNRLDSAFDIGGANTKGLYPWQDVPNPPQPVPFDLMSESAWAANAKQHSPTQQYFIQKTRNAVCKPGFSQNGVCVGPAVNIYRVVARGTSVKGAQRIVETTFVLDVS
jgi:Tfp pilus assembly protein PilX